MQLEIDAIHQPQRLEFFFRQLAGQAACDLIAEFRDTLGDQRPVECIVDVHAGLAVRAQMPNVTGRSIVGPPSRIASRKLPGNSSPAAVSFTGAM